VEPPAIGRETFDAAAAAGWSFRVDSVIQHRLRLNSRRAGPPVPRP
jgi:hypothetical protein